MASTDPETADLPSLPEGIEDWIRRASDNPVVLSVVLCKRNAARFSRVAGWTRETDGALHDWVVATVRTYVVEYGTTTFGLDTVGDERAVWTARIASTIASATLFTGLDHQALFEASWRLTFEATQKMIDSASAAPRLMQEIGTVMREALQTFREAGGAGDRAAIEAIRVDGQAAKFDRLIQLVEATQGKAPATAAPAVAADTKTPGAVQQLLGALTDDELAAVVAHPLGRTVVRATEWSALQSGIASLWPAVTAGEIVISKPSLDKVRAVVKALNA